MPEHSRKRKAAEPKLSDRRPSVSNAYTPTLLTTAIPEAEVQGGAPVL